MKSGHFPFAAAVFAACLGGCALQPPSDDAAPEPQADGPVSDASHIETIYAKQPERPFSTATLYSLLAAEIAGSRQQYDVALSNYAQQARETRDPRVAERATLIARFLNANRIAAETAQIWVEEEPDNPDAISNAALALMQDGQLLAAFGMSQRLQAMGRETLFQSIAANAGSQPGEKRAELLAAFQAQLQQHPKDEQLLIGTGLLLQMQGTDEAALRQAQTALKIHPDSLPAALLEATLLHQLGHDREALERMNKLLERHPDNLRLRLQYARILTRHDLALAQKEFEILSSQAPEDPDLRLSLGLVALENGDMDTAANAFEQLLDSDQHLSSAHYYLAQIAEQQEDIPRAIIHYLRVEPGRELLPATQRLLTLLISKGDLDSAREHINRLSDEAPDQREGLQQLHAQVLIQHQHLAAAESLLDDALRRAPDNNSLQFSRALLHEKQGRLTEAERDLRNIIERDPNNSAALNALGYILTDHNIRLDEARELLSRALALNPLDPAIIDSVGWHYYRTGNYPEALTYLRRAYEAHPDPEIAAHLGEVLWVIGEHDQALGIWRGALESEPDNEIILRTLERLQVPAP